MRIVHITNAGGFGRVQFGGGERAVAELARGARAEGHDVCVIGPPQFLRGYAGAVGSHVAEMAVGPADLARMIRKLRSFEPDVVVLHLLRAAAIGRVAQALSRPRVGVVVNLHNSLQETFDARAGAWLKKKIMRLSFRLVMVGRRCRTVAISMPNFSDLIEKDHIRENKVALIRNWVSEEFEPLSGRARACERVRMGVADSTVLVGFLGRLEYQKNPQFAVEVCSLMEEGTTLVLAGDGVLRREVSDLAAKLGVAVRFLGHVPRPSVFLATCDVVLMPSRFEGFGRVAVEALASGSPVVVSKAPGLMDAVKEFGEEDVAIRNTNEADLWADAARCLARGGSTGRTRRSELAHKLFGYNQALEAYLRLYAEVAFGEGYP